MVKNYIKTKRFYLKILKPIDVKQKYFNWFNQKEIKKNIKFSSYKKISELKKYVLQQNNAKNIYFFGVFDKNKNHIGNIKFDIINKTKKIAYLGILIGDKKWRGKGAGQEIIEASCNYLSHKENINFFYLGVSKKNYKAIKLYKNCNFIEKKKDPNGNLTMMRNNFTSCRFSV